MQLVSSFQFKLSLPYILYNLFYLNNFLCLVVFELCCESTEMLLEATEAARNEAIEATAGAVQDAVTRR